MKEKTCCFTGHRKIIAPIDDVQHILYTTIEKLINSGVIYYGAGGALGFDTLAALTVIKLRNIYPHIKLIMVLPCKEQTKGWRNEDVETYSYILRQADKVVYTSEKYYPGCMHKRNRHLVDNSSHCICYLEKSTGGTAYTVNYANKSGLKIYNVANELNK